MNIFIFDYLIYYTFKSQQIGNVRGVIFVTDEFCLPPLICKQIIVYVIIFFVLAEVALGGGFVPRHQQTVETEQEGEGDKCVR